MVLLLCSEEQEKVTAWINESFAESVRAFCRNKEAVKATKLIEDQNVFGDKSRGKEAKEGKGGEESKDIDNDLEKESKGKRTNEAVPASMWKMLSIKQPCAVRMEVCLR